MENEIYRMYVCLPYLHLPENRPLGLGPIRFYPSSSFDAYLSSEDQSEIRRYLENAPEVNKGTSVCIHPSVKPEATPELLVDAVYLLYFSAYYEPLFHNRQPPAFAPLTEYVPATGSVASNPQSHKSLKKLNLKDQFLMEIVIENDLMLNALGKVLSETYIKEDQLDPLECRRIIRSIRYFIHCFQDRFRDLLGSGIFVNKKHFKPEDFLFIMTAFETLFDLSKDHPNSDLKQKLRPIIHLKFGRPMETIWKWIDGFFKIKEEVVHEGSLPDGIFRDNHNFEVPYISFAIKLFIYSIYFKLFKMGLLPADVSESYRPIAFHGIEREEVIAFLWPEEELLKKISILIMQLTHGKVTDEIVYDVSMLAHIYQHMLKYYQNTDEVIHFIPSQKESLEKIVEAIHNYSDDEFEFHGQTMVVQQLVPSDFLEVLDRRVA